MSGPRFELGTILAEKYRLESLLGEGGMGTVYRAEHLVLKAPVAIKVIDREVAEGDVALARFMREAQAAASLRSPHVVQILDYGMDAGRPFMVMEVLEGETLADRIKSLGPLSPADTFRVISHVARAIAKAHEAGIIHRDLKPDNVFLIHNEGDEIAKVLDFGVAKVDATALGDGSHTRTGSLLGTPYYMSPEQAQGNKEIDTRSDLWSLGVIAFECMTGRRPFSSDGLGDLVLQICIRDIPIPSHFASVPVDFDAWFLRATDRNPDDRFQTAREMSDALRPALGLARDEAGSIPETEWSRAPRPPVAPDGVVTAAGVAKGMAHGTTEKDQLAPPPGLLTMMEDDGAPAGARWEVVATDDDPLLKASQDGNAVSQNSSSADAHARTQSDLSIPPPPKSGLSTFLLVALFAIVLGAGGIYGASRLGFDVLDLEGKKAQAPLRVKAPAGGKGAKKTPGGSVKAPTGPSQPAAAGSKAGAPTGSQPVAPDGDPNATGALPNGDVEDDSKTGKPGDALPADKNTADKNTADKNAGDKTTPEGAADKTDKSGDANVDDALNAIENEAQKKTSPPPKPAPKPGGPSPDLPDHLKTPPPPPPPAP